MKVIRIILLCGIVFAANLYSVHAQTNSSTPEFTVEGLATMLQAIEQATPEPAGSLPQNVENSQIYFGLWASGKNFVICAWNAQRTPFFQAVGDPFVAK